MIRKKIHVPGGLFLKGTEKPPELFPYEILPPPPAVTIPLFHNLNRTALPCVTPGDHVAMGQIIGTPQDEWSAPVHSSVSGKVTTVSRYPYSSRPDAWCVTVENNGNDEFSSPIPYDKPLDESSADELLARLALSGIIDETGTPLHTALARSRQKEKVSTLIVSMVSTEPFLQAREHLCAESPETLCKGADLCRKIAGAEKCLIAVNERKHANPTPLMQLLNEGRFPECSLLLIKTKYPHHHPRLLLQDCIGFETSLSDPMAAAGCMVIGGEAAARARDALAELRPWYERVVTVAGDAIGTPKNLLVRIGTPVKALLEACGCDFASIKKLVAGGPLSGAALRDFDTPVTQSTTALLAFGKAFPADFSFPCIKCRHCSSVCPRNLEPIRLVRHVMAQETELARKHGIEECIECGCCSYVCPSGIDLVHWLKHGKQSAHGSRAPHLEQQRSAA